jgi:transglutaminase superfamily protein
MEPKHLPRAPSSDWMTPSADGRSQASCGPRHWLANLVFVALTRHGAILLDLSRNRYVQIGPAETQILERVVEDWPAGRPGFVKPSASIAESVLIENFLSKGIIRHGPPEPREIPVPSVRLDGELVAIGDEIDTVASVRVGHVAFFLYAFSVSLLALRFHAIAKVVRRIHTRRAAAVRKGDDFEWRRATELVSIFRRIRPFVFVAGGHCLLHALTLVRFLAHYGQFPQLVLGVKADPWGAHSWVQHGDFLLDTNPEKVCGFTVILAI